MNAVVGWKENRGCALSLVDTSEVGHSGHKGTHENHTQSYQDNLVTAVVRSSTIRLILRIFSLKIIVLKRNYVLVWSLTVASVKTEIVFELTTPPR